MAVKVIDAICVLVIFCALVCLVGNAGALENNLVTMDVAVKRIAADVIAIIVAAGLGYITERISE